MKNVAKNDDDFIPTNSTCVNHHQNIVPDPFGVQNVQLTEFRIEEHHEERVGTNIL